MILLIIWWLIGMISYIAGCVIIDKKLTPINILESLYSGILGVFVLLILIYIIVNNDMILKEYKDFLNEDLLNKNKTDE